MRPRRRAWPALDRLHRARRPRPLARRARAPDGDAARRARPGRTAARRLGRPRPDCFDIPPLDVDGYLASIERCRAKFPGLRILTGLELGEPHWFAERCNALLRTGAFERVLGSMHSLEIGGKLWEANAAYQGLGEHGLAPDDLVRLYLAKTVRMIESSDLFAVLAHVDYPVRRFPTRRRPVRPDPLRGGVPRRPARPRPLRPRPGGQHPDPPGRHDRPLVARGRRRRRLVRQRRPRAVRRRQRLRRGRRDGRGARLPTRPDPARLLDPRPVPLASPASRTDTPCGRRVRPHGRAAPVQRTPRKA